MRNVQLNMEDNNSGHVNKSSTKFYTKNKEEKYDCWKNI